MSKEYNNDIEAQTLAPNNSQVPDFGANMSRQMSVQLTAEQFEKLYLQPGGAHAKGDLTKRFGNPTPIGVASFLLVLTPFSCELMGWGGVTATAGNQNAGAFYFLGLMALTIASIMEWILGNTFTSVVFMTFGGFYGTFAYVWTPTNGIIEAAGGALSKDYNHAVAMYLGSWAVLTFVYMIVSISTNVVFFLLFVFLDVCFWLLFTLYIRIGYADPTGLDSIQKAAGAFGFLTAICGWYLLVAILFASNGIPIPVPVGDLSGIFKKKQLQ